MDHLEKTSKGVGLKPTNNKSRQRKPNHVDWRSQNLGSKGQPNCQDEVRSLWGKTPWSYSYDKNSDTRTRLSVELLMIL